MILLANGMLVASVLSVLFRGLFYELESNLMMLFLWLLGSLYFLAKLAKGESFRCAKRVLLPGLLLLIAHGVSVIHLKDRHAHIQSVIQYGTLIMTALVVHDAYRERKDKFFVIFPPIVSLVGGIVALIGLVPSLSRLLIYGVPLMGNRPSDAMISVFQYPNTTAMFLFSCAILALATAETDCSGICRAFFHGISGLLVFSAMQTGSRGGFILGSLGVLIYVFLQPKGGHLRILLVCMAAVAPFLAVVGSYNQGKSQESDRAVLGWIALAFLGAMLGTFVVNAIHRFLQMKKQSKVSAWMVGGIILLFGMAVSFLLYRYRGQIMEGLPLHVFERLGQTNFLKDKNLSYRFQFARDAWRIIQMNWLTGVGGGGWTALYQSVQDTFYVARDAHNHYLETFVELGVLGFASLVAVVGISLFSYARAILHMRKGAHQPAVLGMGCAFFVLASHSAMDFNLSYFSLHLLFWIMMAGASLLHEEKEKKRASGWQLNLLALAGCVVMVGGTGLLSLSGFYGHRGLVHLKAEAYDASVRAYREAGTLDPFNPEFPFELSKLYAGIAKHAREDANRDEWMSLALAEAQRSVALHPVLPAYLKNLGGVYLAREMPMEAVDAYRRLVVSQRCDVDNYRKLVQALMEGAEMQRALGRTEEALDLLRECQTVAASPFVGSDPRMEKLLDKVMVQYAAISGTS